MSEQSRPTTTHSKYGVHSVEDTLIVKKNGSAIEGDWQTMERLAKDILSAVDDRKTDFEKAKQMGSGVHIRVSCGNCGITHESEYARDLTETPQEHVDYPDKDCTHDDITVEAFCPRHGVIPLSYDECDECASVRGMMNR